MYFANEDDPLMYLVLLNNFFKEVHGYHLRNLDQYTEWIKPRGWCHKVVLQREQLNYCKHLQGVEPPLEDVERTSELTLHSHWAVYEAAKQSGVGKQVKKTKATLLEFLILHGLEEEYNYIMGGEKGEPPNILDTVPMEISVKAETAVSRGGGDAPSACKHVSWEEQVQMRDDEEQAAKEVAERRLPSPPQREQPPPLLWLTPQTMIDSLWSRGENPATEDRGILPRTQLREGGLPRPPVCLSNSH